MSWTGIYDWSKGIFLQAVLGSRHADCMDSKIYYKISKKNVV
jgi:hypothetical protein